MLIVILTLPKIIICLTIRPSSRPFLTVSLQSVGKISQISLRYSLTINTIIKSDQNMGNDLHYLIHINSHLRRTPKVCLWPHFEVQIPSVTAWMPDWFQRFQDWFQWLLIQYEFPRWFHFCYSLTSAKLILTPTRLPFGRAFYPKLDICWSIISTRASGLQCQRHCSSNNTIEPRPSRQRWTSTIPPTTDHAGRKGWQNATQGRRQGKRQSARQGMRKSNASWGYYLPRILRTSWETPVSRSLKGIIVIISWKL